ncbi:MAG TPA: acyl-ACP--UDP-N-acetylglucosamine O-acyltransferase [Candidatus Omnitrophota bacterium]|nr:acyl-ACP--UDP-N-acetylglucosamine O-acyltransferase [Candidatus Omnitrophota bacterium]HRZ15745.1 acyl-ACP--UDP-N-acetylglucosamine O-acyltransferase [Candidatus Omnitrophota bacterium]
MNIHPTALVSQKAHLAADVQVGPFAIIEDNVTIGSGTKIGAYCLVTGHTTIGKQCEIFTGAIVGARPQDLKFKGEKSFLEIGDHNTIREYCTINPGTGEGGKTVIGSHNLFMANAHIAHDCIVGDHCIIVNCGTLGGHVCVEDYGFVSGLTAVHQFVRVGKHSILGGCSKAIQDIPPFSTCDGHPARVFGLNLIGLKRHGVSVESIKCLKRAFRVLFNSGIPAKKAADQLDPALMTNKDVAYLVEFIKNSERGVARSCQKDDYSEGDGPDVRI